MFVLRHAARLRSEGPDRIGRSIRFQVAEFLIDFDDTDNDLDFERRKFGKKLSDKSA